MIDRTTQLLFGEFPRDVGNPKRRTVYSLQQLENFIAQNNGVSDCYVGIYPNSLKITEFFFDLDGRSSLRDAKGMYSFLRQKGYPIVPVASGKKGYHLHLLVKGNGGSKEILTEVSYAILNTIFEEGLAGTTVDPHSIGDLRRLCRIPNTLRPPENLNYCTYLPPNFTDMSEKEVAEQIKSPHDYDYDLRGAPTLSELRKEFGRNINKLDLKPKSIPEGIKIDWIIERYVPKVEEGYGYWMGRCPFHPDKNPSFAVYPDHFHCFGCGAHGNIIDFIEMIRKRREVK